MPLEITEATIGNVHVLDARGTLVASYPTRREADAFVAGYKTGRNDAAAIVRDQAVALERVGR